MQKSEIEDVILGFLADDKGLEAQALKDGARLFTDRLLTSMDLIELVSFIETRFHVKIETFETGLEQFDSLAAMVQLVASKLGR